MLIIGLTAVAVLVIAGSIFAGMAIRRWMHDVGDLIYGLFHDLQWHPNGWVRRGLLRRYQPPEGKSRWVRLRRKARP